MRIVIHAGMHKTGSSSIQDFMGAQTDEEIVYARWGSSNHCGLFILLFQNPELFPDYHGFKARGPAFLATLPEQRAKWRQSITEDLERSRDKTFVFSAEDISSPRFPLACQNMFDFFSEWTDDITVIGYVRDPLSFAVSAFQQQLKDHTVKTFDPNTLWPRYRQRFEHLDEIFGRDRTTLRIYDREYLRDGDVVTDFAALLGTDTSSERSHESNQSLSAEATALLFLQRSLGDGYVAGFPSAQMGNNVFIEALRQIGTRRFTFSQKIWGEVTARNQEDLTWMEERLGQALPERRPADAFVVTTAQDLRDLAVAQLPEVEALLIETLRKREDTPLRKTRRVLDLLRKASY